MTYQKNWLSSYLVEMMFFIVGVFLFLSRSNQMVWVLLSLELMNLGLINFISFNQSSAWLMYLLSFQVMESVLLISLILMNLRSFSIL